MTLIDCLCCLFLFLSAAVRPYTEPQYKDDTMTVSQVPLFCECHLMISLFPTMNILKHWHKGCNVFALTTCAVCVRGFYSVLNYECYNQLSVRQRPAVVLQALDAAAVLTAVRRGRSGDWMSSRRVGVSTPAEDQPVQARQHTHITLLYELLEL